MSITVEKMEYSQQTVRRADRAFRCSPFQVPFLQQMLITSVAFLSLVGQAGVDAGYSDRPLSELAADGQVNWLIKVGLLRREVDGQGLTDNFRLTPLGRQILAKYTSCPPQPATVWERLHNLLQRLLSWGV